MKTVTTARKTYGFSAAHWIPTVADGHKCKRLHGHTYHVAVEVDGYDETTGMCVDFERLDFVVGDLIRQHDHTTLNNSKPLDVPTVEVISRYFFDVLREELPIVSVTVREGEGGEATTTRAVLAAADGKKP